MTSNDSVQAVIWDYDGTLVDTWQKNLNVTREVVRSVAGIDPATIPVLQTLEQYTVAHTSALNWRHFYAKEFHLTEEQIDKAGRVWTEFQQKDKTPTPLFDGIAETVHALGMLPHGVVSQNSRSTISRVLEGCGLLSCFRTIIGYEEVDLRRQKPAPDGLLRCINELMDSREGTVLYIGDHETDARCAANATLALRASGSRITLKTVGILHSASRGTSDWNIKPDHEVRNARDIVHIALGGKQTYGSC